ncbi:hypothetical protein NQ318_012057 [Aromia moschata]|uniref:Uncharacterized protein n=1 Tax=Aromia moschata TaxID=1265417 RepID=A0AAV8XKH3_9CUCU|nr:hypothetical protein NQ318_012057 [Aromia moschata]
MDVVVDEEKPKVCKVCLECCENNFIIPDKEIKRKFQFVLANPDAYVPELLCNSCNTNLEKCYNFKSSCICTENRIPSCRLNSDAVNLEDEYSIQEGQDNENIEDYSVCRLCFKPAQDKPCTLLSEIAPNAELFKMVLACYFPELDLKMGWPPRICVPCQKSLESYCQFVKKFTSIKREIQDHREIKLMRDSEQTNINLTTENCTKVEVKCEGDENVDLNAVQGYHRNECIDKGTHSPEYTQERKTGDWIIKPEEVNMKMDEDIEGEWNDHINQPDVTDSPKAVTYQCESCNYNTTTRKHLIDHVATQHTASTVEDGDKVVYKCLVCKYKTEHNSLLRMHVSVMHACEKTVENEVETCHCRVCDEKTNVHLRCSKIIRHDESVKYKCGICEFRTNCKDKLKEHAVVHKDEAEVAMYRCEICQFKTRNKRNLRYHQLTHKGELDSHACGKTIDSGTKTRPCEICDDKPSDNTNEKYKLRQHEVIHKDESEVTMYQCESCEFKTRHKRSLKYHQLTHKGELETTMYRCGLCEFKTRRKFFLKRHHMIHKDKSEVTTYRCETCDFTTKYKYYLKAHQVIHKSESEVEMYQCDACEFKTKYKSSIELHLLTHKTESELIMYQCEICDFKTKLKSYLKRHHATHRRDRKYHQLTDKGELDSHACETTVDNGTETRHCEICDDKPSDNVRLKRHKMYKCETCEFKTNEKYKLRQHEVIHKDESEVTMYQCESCQFKTRHKRSLKYHQLTHKGELETTMYRCGLCEFKTRRKFFLKRHHMIHKDKSEVTTYRCETCDFTTKYKYYLKAHQVIHKSESEVEMYQCDACEFKTKYKSSIELHLLTHKTESELIMYQCEICDFKTKLKSYLKRHHATHRRDRKC